MVALAQDPTLSTLAKFKDASLWVVRRGVPVFDAHDEFDKDGKLVRHFGASELQKIADNCNRREAKTGDACPLTLGHTIPGAPEEKQPQIVGYARNFRLGKFGPEQKLAILADCWFLKDRYQEAMTFPRRSVELFPRDMVFDPIALLRRTPQRDLGLLTYSREHAQMRYGRDGAALSVHYRYPRETIRYSMEAYSVDDFQNQDTQLPPENHQEPDGDELPPEEQAKADSYMRHYIKHHPVMRYAHDQYSMSPDKAKYDAASGGMAGEASGSNTFVPGMVEKKGAGEGAPEKDEAVRMQREAQAIQYAREFGEMKAKLAEQEKQLQSIHYAKRKAEAEAVCKQLVYEGYQLPDVAKEVERMAKLDESARNERVSEIRLCYNRAPVGEQFVRTPEFVHQDIAAEKNAIQFSRQDREKCVAYAAQHGITFMEAYEKMFGTKKAS